MTEVNELADLCDQVLTDNMAPGFKGVIDRLLARGASHRAIAEFVEKKEKAAGGSGLALASVEAYLRSKGNSDGR